jgi:hypothetical protein
MRLYCSEFLVFYTVWKFIQSAVSFWHCRFLKSKLNQIKIMFKQVKIILFSMLFVASHFLAQAQNEKTEAATNIKAAYMGSIVYPGFKVGIERPYKHIEKTKKNGKVIQKDRFLSLNLGFYKHQTFHSNVYLLAERIRRRTAPSGFFMETAPGIGVSRTFLDGTTYNVSDAGEVTKKTAAGYTYAMLSLAGSIGYDFSKKSENRPFAMYLKPSVFVMLPYNSFVYARPTLELGIIYKPSNFLNHDIKNIKK